MSFESYHYADIDDYSGYQPNQSMTDEQKANPPKGGSGVPEEKVTKSYCFDSEANGKRDEHTHSILAILDFLIELDKKIEGSYKQSELQEDIIRLKNSILGMGMVFK
jgi:hypothetical protein